MTTTLAPGLSTSPIGFGCMALSHVYGGTSDDAARRTLAEAIDAGITFLDTADVYGEPRPGATGPAGTNEEMLAPLLAEHRDRVQLATKFGITGALAPAGDGSVRRTNGDPDYVRASCDASLRRLGVDTIDLYYQHRPDHTVPIEETMGALGELVQAGKIRHIGLSEVTADEIRRAHAAHPVAAVQSEWSVWSRDVEKSVVPACAELGIGFVPYSPLGRGFLTGTLTREQIAGDLRGGTDRMGEHWDVNQRALAIVAEQAERLEATNAQVALAWLLAKGRQLGLPVVPIPGSRRAERMIENLGATQVALDDEATAPALAGDVFCDPIPAPERPLSIAEVCELLGVSAHTVRYYERLGLVRAPRDSRGHRVYDEAALRRLTFLVRMRLSGMGISDLQRYIALVDAGDATIDQRQELLVAHADAMRQRIADLQLALAVTEHKIAVYGGRLGGPPAAG